MNISFLDFWEYPKPFDPNNNFITHLLRLNYDDINIVRPDDANIIIYSCYGDKHKKYKHCKKIFYTGECLRPDYNECDYSITFDFDDYSNRNLRIPLWYFYIDWFKIETYDNPEYLIPVNYLYGDNEFTKKVKYNFCSTVYSKFNQTRSSIVSEISKYKQVDCFGKIHSNSIPDGEKNKLDIISNYKFNLCFENTIYPGYFTEKIIHAKVAGCIPLYFSDKTWIEDFNPKCAINLIDYENIDDFVDYIIHVDRSKDMYNSILNEPLFNITPNIYNLNLDIIMK